MKIRSVLGRKWKRKCKIPKQEVLEEKEIGDGSVMTPELPTVVLLHILSFFPLVRAFFNDIKEMKHYQPTSIEWKPEE